MVNGAGGERRRGGEGRPDDLPRPGAVRRLNDHYLQSSSGNRGSVDGCASVTMPIRPKMNELARSRTISLGESSRSSLVAPARAAPTANERLIFCRGCSVTCGLLSSRDRCSLLTPAWAAGRGDGLCGALDHDVDSCSDLGRDALWLFRRDVFHDLHREPSDLARNAPSVMFFKSLLRL